MKGSRKDRVNRIAMVLFAVIAITAGVICTECEIAKEKESQYIAIIPMVNQHIEWTWAGKGGF